MEFQKKDVCHLLQEILMLARTSRLQYIQKKYKIVLNIKAQFGFAWNNKLGTGIDSTSEAVWVAYIRQYIKVGRIYTDVKQVAQGSWKVSLVKKSGPAISLNREQTVKMGLKWAASRGY
ncbi:hypothetical protein BDR06DRAFT_966353 [Suillus hirtellus]|nr:hypothetical protein BDR06DRAFT_966353 [Suillus hirtellus]